jgi:hypothetical protein
LWNGFAYANGNCDSNGGSVGNANSNGDGNWSAVYPDAQTSSHRATASIGQRISNALRIG